MGDASNSAIKSRLDIAESSRLRFNEKLGLIGLINEGLSQGKEGFPSMADFFSNLWEMVEKTATGANVDHLPPDDSGVPFRKLELKGEAGEFLGRLNMLYLKKPSPCYYLVYVEVAAPYRNRGLGNKIIKSFGEFLNEKSAIGLLDNIIPKDDPTCDIYIKHGWRSLYGVLRNGLAEEDADYMIYIPDRLKNKDLNQAIIRMVYHLKRRRTAIEMRDNEAMVRQTIAEFKELYTALVTYFEQELDLSEQSQLMRFMFTRFTTKLIAFRRRITTLLGYTGGESLAQIQFHPAVLKMPIQSYVPREISGGASILYSDEALKNALPEKFIAKPARSIEALSNYARPSLVGWLEEKNRRVDDPLTIGDLLDLGFDPTRLKVINLAGGEYIFERMQARQYDDMKEKLDILSRLSNLTVNQKINKADIRVNPPLMMLGNLGNLYVLRKKISGIHWEEALAQLQTKPELIKMNEKLKLERMIKSTIKKATSRAVDVLDMDLDDAREKLTWFTPWNTEHNQPKVVADFSGAYLECIWAS